MAKLKPPNIGAKAAGIAVSPEPRVRAIPAGYRQGLITAITVLLGFSLAFVRFWGFESPGHWTWRSLVIAVIAATAVVLQLVALIRALRPQDDDEREYRTTVRWFVASAVALVLGLLVALVESAVA
jgi:4-amino-4-deoxy-L-arabinose transferase-like glycosyltransferase